MHRYTLPFALVLLGSGCGYNTIQKYDENANAAKNHAKSTEKGRIATFEGVLFRDGDLALA